VFAAETLVEDMDRRRSGESNLEQRIKVQRFGTVGSSFVKSHTSPDQPATAIITPATTTLAWVVPHILGGDQPP
jgi:hypothetical protein